MKVISSLAVMLTQVKKAQTAPTPRLKGVLMVQRVVLLPVLSVAVSRASLAALEG